MSEIKQLKNPDEGSDDRDMLVLYDDDGNEVNFELAKFVEYKDDVYACLLPEDEDQIVILKLRESGEDMYFDPVEESVVDAVFELFLEKFGDEIDLE